MMLIELPRHVAVRG